MKWAVGDNVSKLYVEGVCKSAFCNAYRVSSSHVDNVIKEIKGGVSNAQQLLGDRSKTDMKILPHIQKIAKCYGLHLSQKQVAAARLPNSTSVLSAYAWMAHHFALVGDMAPNRDGEIHLEPVHYKEVHKEYCEDMNSSGLKVVCVDTFCSIWRNCFQHVKIREFKAVCGKCQCCAKLSSMRKKFKSQQQREYVTSMHALHRSAYMVM